MIQNIHQVGLVGSQVWYQYLHAADYRAGIGASAGMR